ncbi:MAG: ribosome-associated translation inhibitor RaiA [Actinobacteria bacterium]|nr:ribosome-associated translation inhibitor RaiA [Actinomycetota bacterium]MBU1945232.1 ribosome-associated translation inhibitor RaiA [Actinomycetota bacterium]MBU2687804.1 ribosome-associated translation inhibitor RaiA [Actinomycetota bacterium]
MQIVVKGKNIEVTESLRRHAEQKVAKLGKLGLGFKEVEVKLEVEKNPSIQLNQKAEVTLFGNGPLLRAEEADRDMYIAVDKAVAKLQRQIKKYHGKQIGRSHGQVPGRRLPAEEGEEERAEPTIVRTKTISIKPMTPEEAALQMEMLGHDFYVFTNSDTGSANVVYRRNDGDYGLIDTSG